MLPSFDRVLVDQVGGFVTTYDTGIASASLTFVTVRGMQSPPRSIANLGVRRTIVCIRYFMCVCVCLSVSVSVSVSVCVLGEGFGPHGASIRASEGGTRHPEAPAPGTS